MKKDILQYHNQLEIEYKTICNSLAILIDKQIPEAECKIWHSHPVWFIDKNPIVGYSLQKAGIRLMFWSGKSFEENNLIPGTGKFMDASIFFTSIDQINHDEIIRWLEKSKHIQWDYKNLVKMKGVLQRLK